MGLQTPRIGANLHRVVAWEWNMWNEHKLGPAGAPKQVSAVALPDAAPRPVLENSNRKLQFLEYDPTH